MDAFSSLLVVVAAVALALVMLGIWGILRGGVKRARAHSEPRSAVAPPPARRPAVPAAAIPGSPQHSVETAVPTASLPGPAAALMTYRKADGSTRVRSLTIHSRNLKVGQTHTLNCRQVGEQITKQFLLGGISRLERPGLVPPQRPPVAGLPDRGGRPGAAQS